MAKKRYRTEEQTEGAQAKVVRFAENVLDDPDLADALEDLTPEEYAERKGIQITNQGEMKMPTGTNGMTKDDMADCLDAGSEQRRHGRGNRGRARRDRGQRDR